MDDKGKDWVERYRDEEFQRSKERLARFNQQMEKVTPKPTLRQWIRDALVAVAIGCGLWRWYHIYLAFVLGRGQTG